MKHTFIRIAIAAILIMFSPHDTIAASVEDDLRSIANATQKGLPIRVNDDLQATSITSTGKAMLHRYHFMKKSSSISDVGNLKEEFFRNSLNATCTHPDMMKLISRGAFLKYDFYDMENRFVFGYAVDKETCKSFQ